MRVQFIAFLALSACGRSGFSPIQHDGSVSGGADAGVDGAGTLDASGVPSGLALWLPMDEPIVSMMTPEVAEQHGVQCLSAGCPTFEPNGRHGGALRFVGGADSGLSVAMSSDLEVTGPYSVAAWVNLDQLPPILACAITLPYPSSNNTAYALCVAANGNPVVNFGPMSGTYSLGNSGIVFTPGTWHHLAWTWDGTTARAYADGISLGASGGGSIDTANQPISIGASFGASGRTARLQGLLDDVMIWRRVLTPAEINLLQQ